MIYKIRLCDALLKIMIVLLCVRKISVKGYFVSVMFQFPLQTTRVGSDDLEQIDLSRYIGIS
jgi:hypothetical protein